MLMSGVILVTQPAFLFPVPELLMSSNQTLQSITNISEVTQVFGIEISNTTIGVCFAILASICNSINGITTNQLKDTVDPESGVITRYGSTGCRVFK